MHMRIIGIPVIDRDPVDWRAEIAGHVVHQLARERAQVSELGRIFWRDDKPEMVSVIRAALRECLAIGIVPAGIEQLAALVVARHAIALKVGDVKRKRRGPEPRALVTHDARFDHHTALIRRTPGAQRGRSASTISSRPGRLAAPASERRCPGAARRLEHLADERGGLAAGRHALVPRSAGADLEVVVLHGRTKESDVA